MQKQGFYFAHHCCCTNARLLGKYPGHQFGKLEIKKKQYWNSYWNWDGIGRISIGIGRIPIGIGFSIGIGTPIGIGIENPIENPIGIGIFIGNHIGIPVQELNSKMGMVPE